MREFKFRAWDKADKKYIYDIYPASNGDVAGMYNGRYCLRLPSDRVIIEQFTGLKDKNVTYVFEGDVCEFYLKKERLNLHDKDEYIKLEGSFLYDDDSLRYEIELLPKYEKEGYLCLWYNPDTMKDFKVIGNIHDKN